MKAYVCNCVQVITGVLLSWGVSSGWLRWVTDYFVHGTQTETLGDTARWAVIRAAGLLICLFCWACLRHPTQPAAPQSAPSPMTLEEIIKRAKYAPHFGAQWRRQVLVGTFGVVSAVVGAVMLAAHLWRGVPVTQVMFCIVVVPAYVALGMWLIAAALSPQTKG